MKYIGYLLLAALSGAAGALAMHLLARPPTLGGETVSYESVERLSSRDVAERVLPPLMHRLADNVVAVGFGGSSDPQGTPEDMVIDFVDLRLRAKGAGWRGVCVADNLGIELEPVRTGRGPARGEPNGSLHVRPSYRVVGDTTHDKEWSDAYARELDDVCAKLGPDASFFSVDEGFDLRALTDMLPALRGADTAKIECTGNTEACRSPRTALAALQPGHLVAVSSTDQCDQRQTCLELTFSTGRGSPPAVWIARAKGTYRGTYPTGWGKLVLSELKLSYH